MATGEAGVGKKEVMWEATVDPDDRSLVTTLELHSECVLGLWEEW